MILKRMEILSSSRNKKVTIEADLRLLERAKGYTLSAYHVERIVDWLPCFSLPVAYVDATLVNQQLAVELVGFIRALK